MKKIFPLLLALCLLPFAVGCDEDRDSNPVYTAPTDGFVLNEPAYAAQTIDLASTDSLRLTTSQPAYGFTAATTYTVQLALVPEFADGDTPNYVSLPTTQFKANMALGGKEFSNSFNELWAAQQGNSTALPAESDVYVRLTAELSGADGLGRCVSNVIKLHVRPYIPPTTAEPASSMYFIGAMPACDGWSKWIPLANGYGEKGYQYGVIYFTDNCDFKFGPSEGIWDECRTWGQATVDDQAGAGIAAGADAANGNWKVTNGGWYTIVVETTVKNDEVVYTLHVLPAEVYLFGATNGGIWAWDDANKFTLPETADGDFVSPALSAAGELRIAVKTTIDWWKTELSFSNTTGNIQYRDLDIVNNWEETYGADFSVKGSAGQKVHINFTTGKGSLQ